ncbi:MAG TPA: hypothetical protein VKB38_22725 [Terracidiphilus sp.]|nr:hypothetical protein [Terracidiphilus sp.]
MQAILGKFRNPFGSLLAGTWIGLFVVLIFGLGVITGSAQKPAVVVSQASLLFDVQGGGCPGSCGFNAQLTPNGGGFGVDGWGDVAISMPYGNITDIYNGTTGKVIQITSLSNQSGASFDSHRNLFIGPLYKHKLIKVPFVGGTWVSGNPDTDPACTGNDTVECGLPNIGTDYNSDVDFKNTAFDSAGNLFMVTATDNVHGGNSIYMLPAAGLYNTAPTLVFTDDATHAIASIAFDPWGNLFFTDVVYSSGGQSNQHATSAYVNELPYSSSSGYASSKTVLVTHTIASPSDYDNALSGVAVDRSGTVYYSDINGTWAIPNNPSVTPAAANAYLVAASGGKQLMVDGNGNLYTVAYDSGAPAVFRVLVNNLVVPASAVATESTASIAAALNDVDCSGSATFALAGGNATTASGATSGSCQTESLAGVSGAYFSGTVNLTPAVAGTNVALMTATDSAHHNSGFSITGGALVGHQAVVVSETSSTFEISGGGCPSCGFNAQMTPNGGSFGVSKDDDIAVSLPYGNVLDVYDAATSTMTPLTGSLANESGATFDTNKNIFVGPLYKHKLIKVPYVAGSWVIGNPDSDPACTGTDTVECGMPNIGTDYNSDVDFKNTAFDSAGNLFMVTATDNVHGGNSIYMLPAASLYTTTPTLVYTDDATHAIASIAFDPWGNLFFTDVVYSSGGQGNQHATAGYLNVLPYSPASGYAAAKTVLVTAAVASPSDYDNALSAVAVDANGAVYYSDGNETFALANNPLTPADIANAYLVSQTGGKQLMPDGQGGIYSIWYDSGGKLAVLHFGVNNIVVPAVTIGFQSTITDASAALNSVDCTGSATFTFAGGTASGASASTTGNCSTITFAGTSGSMFGASVSLTPLVNGVNTATLTATDSASNTSTVNVSGYGNPIAGVPQIITFTAPASPVTYAPGIQITVSATGGDSGNPVVFSVDSASTAAATVSGSVLTVTQAGTLIIDANQAGGDLNGTTYAAAAQVQRTVVISKATQTLQFAQPDSPVNMAPSLTVALKSTAGASSSPVVFSVDATSTGSGTVSGSTLTPTGVGTIVIDANQAADANYLAAPQVQQSIVVNQGSQTITFVPLTQPLHYIMGGLQVSISANGGASNNPVVFTVDAKSPVQGTFAKSTVNGSTSVAVLSVPDQASLANMPSIGVPIMIDATQPGNANYSDATPGSQIIVLLPPLPTQTITFANPGTQVAGTPLKLSATSSSGFPVNFNVSPSSACSVATTAGVSTVTFSNSGTSAVACSIVASQPGDNLYYAAAPPITQTVAVNPTGVMPGMTMTLSLSDLTIQPGTVGLSQITVNSVNNFTGSVSFACSGAPAGYTCSFNPTTISTFTADPTTGLPGGTSASTQFSISGGSASAAVHGGSRPLFPVATLAVALCLFGFRKRNRLFLMMLAVAAFAGISLFSGCGGASSSPKTAAPTTAQVTITATSGSTSKTATVNVTVN